MHHRQANTLKRRKRAMIIVGTIFFTILACLTIWILVAGPKLPAETDAIIDEVLNNELPELFTGKTGVVTSCTAFNMLLKSLSIITQLLTVTMS